MNNIVNFILESGISLAVLSVLYLVFLRKETYFRTNRIFLLLSVVFSLLLPFMRIPVYTPQQTMIEEVKVTPYQNLLETVMVTGQGLSENVEKAVAASDYIIAAYVAGVILFLLLFFIKIYRLLTLIRRGRIIVSDGYRLVICDSENTPFAFLNYIFVNRNNQDNPDFNRMLRHEAEHVRQGHTFDLLILEILIIFQWFNPFIWILRRALHENHEYLADRAVLDTGIRPAEYKELLLSRYIGGSFSAASHFNYSLVRNRLHMMSRMKSSKAALVKIAPGILISAALIVVFACEQTTAPANSEAQHSPVRVEKSTIEILSISGEKEDLVRISEMLAEGNYSVTYDQEAGKVLLTRNEASATNETRLKSSGTTSAGIRAGQAEADSSLKRHISTSEFNTTAGQDQPIRTTTTKTRDEKPGDGQVFYIVEEMPEFPGGESALRNHIASTVQYPPEAQQKGIQGRVYVTFIVTKDGSVQNAKIARGVDPELDKEALRVVTGLPAWKPGRQKGEAVNVSYTVPINFVLQ